jgi:glycerophosphoryl diester phosphodiesterase
MDTIIKVAHRGASGYEPENTLLAFKKAMKLNADMIELDVHACKTGELVVMHDDTVDRTTNGKGRVEDMTLEELKGLELQKGERIPTLEEVLDFTDRKIKLNIELKAKNIALQVRAIIEEHVGENGWSYEDFLISSFHHKELAEMKQVDPEIRIGVLTEVVPPGYLKFAEEIKAYSVDAPINRIDGKFVEKAHEMGLKVFVYAANNSGEIEKAKKLNVDYICSDFPDKI